MSSGTMEYGVDVAPLSAVKERLIKPQIYIHLGIQKLHHF